MHPSTRQVSCTACMLNLALLQSQVCKRNCENVNHVAGLQGLCHVISSGSGATSGLLVLFIVDMAFNFETIRFPVLRILAATILLGLFIAAAVVRGLPARLSVLGGALTALFPALSMLPHLKSEKYEWWIPYMSMLTTVGILLALPLYVYLKRLPGIAC